MNRPGKLFPHSWSSTFEVVSGLQPVTERAQGTLVACPEYKTQAASLLEHLKAPIFDKCTEEGLRFRIYRLGSLEVRTTTELQDQEVIGAVFSVRSKSQKHTASTTTTVGDQEKVQRITEYVEAICIPGEGAKAGKVLRRYYLVLETEKYSSIVTERLNDGKLTWVANPEDIEDRTSLAKVTRSE